MKNIVITFHKIPSKKWFNNIINIVGSIYNFVDIKDIQSYYSNNKHLKNACHICFDDGHLSFYNCAYPVLIEKKISTSLFVSPRIIENDFNYWFQDLFEILKIYDESFVKTNICNFFGCTYNEIEKFSVLSIFKSLCFKDIELILKKLKSKIDSKKCRKKNLSLKQLHEVNKNGLITVGAHTMNHPILMNEDYDSAYYEITQSIIELSKLLDKKVKYFAFPNGKPNLDYGIRDIKILKENKIDLAFSTNEKYLNKQSGRFNIPRTGFIAKNKDHTSLVLTKLIFLKYWKYFKNLSEFSKENKSQRNNIKALLREYKQI